MEEYTPVLRNLRRLIRGLLCLLYRTELNTTAEINPVLVRISEPVKESL